MISIGLLIFFTLSINSQQVIECDFDYGEKCLSGLQSSSYVLLNETSGEPRQPASDITAIRTSHEDGEECYFPFQLNSFDMFFCEKTDPNLPATCPIFNSTGPRMNCSEGEYGYERFEGGETGSRLHKLDMNRDLEEGEHCIRFFYYLSDTNSNGNIQVIIEDTLANTNQTILTASQRLQNRWHEIRQNFNVNNDKPNIYFGFNRNSSSDLLPYFIAIDQLTIVDIECEPDNTTTTITTTITPTSTLSTISSSTTASSLSPNTTVTLSTTTSSLTSTTVSNVTSSLPSNTTITTGTSTTTSSLLTSTTTTTRPPITNTSISTSTTSPSTSASTTNQMATSTASLTTPSTSTLTQSTTTTATTEGSSSIKIRSNILLTILFLFYLF
ncbi:unnamed protein product [Adineta steineri]|uniref:MAM domain-containing protein n=1 Tax=Adineta steineri TaxID=433720 RepID=A0A814TG87_9BILA|nr:unnamed protein product [Adineta steineri]CAF1161046.1 unnamed protein product [Adineta steineri]